MSKIIIKLVRSGIGRTKGQKLTLQALGLTKMNKVVEHESTPQILGMVEKVKHLLEVEKL
jgi:ribosomal protein L30